MIDPTKFIGIRRVARAFEQYFSGYALDPVAILQRTFGEVAGYDEIVLLSDIPFTSHCEHHLAPIEGEATGGKIYSLDFGQEDCDVPGAAED